MPLRSKAQHGFLRAAEGFAKRANLRDVQGALVPEPAPRIETRLGPYPLRPNDPGTAVERFRRAVQNRYGDRAPQFTARMLGALDAVERLDPTVARRIRQLTLDPAAVNGYEAGRVSVNSSDPATLLHEFAHARDSLRYPDAFFGVEHDAASHIRSEASATRQAFSQLGAVDPRFSALNGSHWEAAVNRAQVPHSVYPNVVDAVIARKDRLADHARRLQARRSAGSLSPEQQSLLSRLETAVARRQDAAAQYESAIRNPLAAPQLHRIQAAPEPSAAVIEGLDQHVSPGAGRAAYDYEAYLQQLNRAQEHPRVAKARQFFGISAPPVRTSPNMAAPEPPAPRPFVRPTAPVPALWPASSRATFLRGVR